MRSHLGSVFCFGGLGPQSLKEAGCSERGENRPVCRVLHFFCFLTLRRLFRARRPEPWPPAHTETGSGAFSLFRCSLGAGDRILLKMFPATAPHLLERKPGTEHGEPCLTKCFALCGAPTQILAPGDSVSKRLHGISSARKLPSRLIQRNFCHTANVSNRLAPATGKLEAERSMIESRSRPKKNWREFRHPISKFFCEKARLSVP